ncbi:MAG TPA: hypothetical protein PKV98_04390 [Burkholderiaceae bacterium]|nr:hypothetical protein [Burkholderiaceae bacterium]
MISPLIQEEVRLKLVNGAHTTAHGLVFSVGVLNKGTGALPLLPVAFGFMDEPKTQLATSRDLRELAELLHKIASAMEAK